MVVGMTTARDALEALDFGMVDSESEPDLAKRFVRTSDFDDFLQPKYVLVIGAKGSGKSALFEMFSKHLPSTRRLAGDRMNRVLVSTGTGFGDLTELTTADINRFHAQGDFQYDALWKVYIAFKCAIALGQQGYSSTGPLRDFLRLTKGIKDYRIAPILSSAWQLVGGSAPGGIEVNVMGSGATVTGGRGAIDVLDLLADVQDVLQRNNNTLWLLFDKIDELHPTEPDKRRTALEGLFPACRAVQRGFDRIIPRVFIRSDLYGSQLNFPNKDHFRDKQFEIKWGRADLALMVLKRGMAVDMVRDYVRGVVPEVGDTAAEELSAAARDAAFEVIFEKRAYPGPKEALTLKWMIDRASDAKGHAFPRELINYGNISRDKQRGRGGPSETALISGRSVVDAYYDVSKNRREDFLAEFPGLKEHFKRFRGRHDSPFQRSELEEMFAGLEPSGEDAIERLVEIGVLGTGRKDVSTADEFDVPRLYRAGLGLQIIARP
jgi:energy-coupling factor transporter ATP-binding protein EcfA2